MLRIERIAAAQEHHLVLAFDLHVEGDDRRGESVDAVADDLVAQLEARVLQQA